MNTGTSEEKRKASLTPNQRAVLLSVARGWPYEGSGSSRSDRVGRQNTIDSLRRKKLIKWAKARRTWTLTDTGRAVVRMTPVSRHPLVLR